MNTNDPILTADQIAERVRGMAEALDIAAYVERDLRLRAEKAEKELAKIHEERNKDLHVMGLQGKEIERLRAGIENEKRLPASTLDFLEESRSRHTCASTERDEQRNRADAAELEVARLRGEHAQRVQECVVQRTRAADAEAEVARLTVAKMPTAADYDRLIKERDAHARDAARLLTHADNMYVEGKKIQAEYADLKAHVDAAFQTLGKRDDESYEGCAARIMAGVEALRKECAAVTRAAYKDFDTLSAHVAKAHNTLDSRLGESIEDSARRVVAERDAYRKAKAENDERFMLERDAARAELARVREALGTLVSAVRTVGIACEGL